MCLCVCLWVCVYVYVCVCVCLCVYVCVVRAMDLTCLARFPADSSPLFRV